MSIKNLRKDVEKFCDYEVIYKESGFYVDEERDGIMCPGPDGTSIIMIWDELNSEEKIQVEAHELCHLLLKYSGLSAIDINCSSEIEEELFLSINNAISHHKLIYLLDHKYNISSSSFLTQHEKVINNLENTLIKIMKDKPNYYNVWGVQLYDSARILPSRKEEIIFALEKYPRINSAFKIAHDYLGKITIDMKEEKQLELIESFKKELK